MSLRLITRASKSFLVVQDFEWIISQWTAALDRKTTPVQQTSIIRGHFRLTLRNCRINHADLCCKFLVRLLSSQQGILVELSIGNVIGATLMQRHKRNAIGPMKMLVEFSIKITPRVNCWVIAPFLLTNKMTCWALVEISIRNSSWEHNNETRNLQHYSVFQVFFLRVYQAFWYQP